MNEEIISLIKRVQTGDDSAFSQLAVKYDSLLEAAAYRFMDSFKTDNSDSTYEKNDLKQNATMALYKAACTYDPESEKKGKKVTFGLYAKICINNSLISLLRKYNSALRRKRKIVPVIPSKQPDIIDTILQSEGARRLKEEIASALSKYEKEVFSLYIVGKSTDEIALTLNTTEKSVNNALYRIRVKVKGLLKK